MKSRAVDRQDVPEEFAKYPDLILSPPNDVELRDRWGAVDGVLLDKCLEFVSPNVTRGAQYWMMRETGSSDKFAAMIALQSGPALSTDDTFFQGQKPLYDQFGSQRHLDRYLKVSKKYGFTPNPNSTYFSALARFPGDPEAYVSRAQGRSYIRKLCEKRGWACEGAVSVNHREPDNDPLAPEKCKPLGEDIIRRRVTEEIKRNPDMSPKDRKSLREKIIEKHGPTK